MPNWCENAMVIRVGDSPHRAELIQAIKDHRLLEYMRPMQQDVKDDSDNGGDGWYEWRIENWGTKWEIADAYITSDEDDDELEIFFNTAWAPPTAALDFWKTTNTYLPTTLKYIEHGCQIQGTWEDGEHEDDLYDDNCWTCVDCGEKHHTDWEEPDVNDANGSKCANCAEHG